MKNALILLFLSYATHVIGFGSDTVKRIDEIKADNGAQVTIDDALVVNEILNVTGTTTLDTALTGFCKLTSGVVSDQTFIDLTTEITGALPIANGGTNSSTALNNDRVMVSSGGAIVEAATGTNGHVFTLTAGVPGWAAPATGSPTFTTVTKTTTATLAITAEDNVVVDATTADFTVTLPAASGNNGLTYKITKSTAANEVTIDANASETIGGELTVVMPSKDDYIIIYSDGTNWQYAADGILYAARYTSNSGQSIANVSDVDVVCEDLVFDTHSGMNTGTGEYEVQIDGKYMVTFSADLVGGGKTGVILTGIQVDGTTAGVGSVGSASSGELGGQVSLIIDLEKGEDVNPILFQNSGAANLTTDPNRTHISIARIKQ